MRWNDAAVYLKTHIANCLTSPGTTGRKSHCPSNIPPCAIIASRVARDVVYRWLASAWLSYSRYSGSPSSLHVVFAASGAAEERRRGERGRCLEDPFVRPVLRHLVALVLELREEMRIESRFR